MSKLCRCFDLPEPPNISVHINCPSSCCESRLECKNGDVTDFSEEIQQEKQDEHDKETETLCCCFIIKRHANVKKDKPCYKDGGET